MTLSQKGMKYKTKTAKKYDKIEKYVGCLIKNKSIDKKLGEYRVIEKIIKYIPALNFDQIYCALTAVYGSFSRGKLRKILDELIGDCRIIELSLYPRKEKLSDFIPDGILEIRLVKAGKEKLYFKSLGEMEEFIRFKVFVQYAGRVKGLKPATQKRIEKEMKKLNLSV